jgi:hypothetical protein
MYDYQLTASGFILLGAGVAAAGLQLRSQAKEAVPMQRCFYVRQAASSRGGFSSSRKTRRAM